ncbi:hypothetical protein ACIBCR_25360 [Micromonospora echinospora]|uniref:hypothetical protein n=1 Tax=Micromonospora echinospora TaxID=1877 RepID=UPI0037A3E867
MSAPFRPGPPAGGFRPQPPANGPRPGPPGGGPRPGPPPGLRPGPPQQEIDPDDDGDDARHPAVDAAVRALANAATLAPADQIAHYEAAYQTLRETLATIDQT